MSASDGGDRLGKEERALPLTALRAFEAAARHMSFARAADELGVSPAAISQHIQTLEIYAGQPLFRRLGRRIELTDAGAAAQPLAANGVMLLSEAARVMRLPLRSERVAVQAPPAFALKWLTPRLPRFRELHPDIDVWVAAEPGPVDFAGTDVDLAIRYGGGGYSDANAELLMGEAVLPAASPAYLAERGPLRQPSDLAGVDLLHEHNVEGDPACPGWATWLAAHGADAVDARRGFRFNHASLAIEAAASGRGVALVKRQLASADLATGRLAPLFPALPPTPVSFGYFLVWPRGRTLSPAMRAFMGWLRETTAGDSPDFGAGI